MLAFFMLGLIFIAMIQTHNNLKDLHVKTLEAEGGFNGSQFLVTTVLSNQSTEPRFNVEARLKDLKPLSFYESSRSAPEKGTLLVRVAYPAKGRGRHELKRVRLSTVYPLGLFQAWVWHPKSAHYYVYPEKRGDRPLPIGSSNNHDGKLSHPLGGEDFHGHRKFALGDSHHHIDWKAAARGRPGLVKQFTEGTPGTRVLAWNMLPDLDIEDRLCQLSRWIDEARELKVVFSLILPGEQIPFGQGLDHAIRCWEALSECTGQANKHSEADHASTK